MARFTFTPIWSRTYLTYDGNINNWTTPSSPANGSGTGVNESILHGIWSNPQGGRKALVGFDTADIRSKLSGKTVTDCYLELRMFNPGKDPGSRAFILGSHVYTSPPSRWDTTKVYEGTSSDYYSAFARANSKTLFTLDKSYGQIFQSGTVTGFAFGPAPNQDLEYDCQIYTLFPGDAYIMRLHIDVADPVIYSPDTPVIKNPVSGAVFDFARDGAVVDFTYTHRNNNAMDGFYLRYTISDGTYRWWNGTDFVTTQTKLSPFTAVATGSNRRVTIPAGKILNPPATRAVTYFAVSVVDTNNRSSFYSEAIPIYPSAPPSVTIQQPTGQAYRNARPVIRWTYSDPEGQSQYGWIAQIVPSEVYSKTGYDPSQYTGQVWSNSGDVTSQRSAQVDVTLENHKTYRAYVRVLSSPNPSNALQYSPWVYSEFTVSTEPPPPKMLLPRTGSTLDLAAGFTLDWENEFSSEGGSQVQSAYAIRRTKPGNIDEWWNGSTWTTTEFYASGSNSIFSFRANEVSNNIQYAFAVSIRDGYGLVSGYGTPTVATGSTAPQVSLIGPPSLITSVRPTIVWTLYDIDNDPQQNYSIMVIPRPTGGWPETINDPTTLPRVWASETVASQYARSVQCPVELLNGVTYRAYIRLLAGGVYSDWAYAEFTISLIPPAQPIVTTTIDDELGAIRIVAQGRDSVLVGDSSRSVARWEPVGTNLTVTNGELTTSSKSGYQIRTNAVTSWESTRTARTSDKFAVTSDLQYTAAATVVCSSSASPAPSRVGLEFFNEANEAVTTVWSLPLSDAIAARPTLVATAPQAARTARMLVQFSEISNADHEHYFYDPVVRPGSGNEWSPGGLLGSTTVSLIEMNDFRIVRHGINIPLPVESQRVELIDAEVPIGRPQRYEATTRAVYPGAVLVADPVAIDAGIWNSGWLWMSDPTRLDSARCFGPEGFDTETRPARQGKFRPIGRADAIFTRGVRGLREGKFTLVTHTRAEREAYIDLATKSELILLRIPPDRGDVEGETMYVQLEGDLPIKRSMPHRTPHRHIDQEWTEQPRPLTGLGYGEEI